MAREKTQKTKAKKKKTGGGKGSFAVDGISRIYDFGNSAVLLTHLDINQGETVQGHFVGNWETRQATRTEFDVIGVDAKLVLPAMDWRLPGKRSALRVTPGAINLSLSEFRLPAYLQEIFPTPNRGQIDVRKRTYRAVFTMQADLSSAHAKSDFLEMPPADIVFMTLGNIEAGGGLTASGIGRIVSGPFVGLMFSCSHPTTPPKCGAVYPRDSRRCTKPRGHAGRHFNPLRPRVSW